MSSTVPPAVTVRTPATSANLGPGFDALGLALSLYDEVTVEVTAGGLTVEVEGEGAVGVARDGDNLVVRALRAALARLGFEPPGLAVRCRNHIPHGRGLGSSAAAICAGVVAARALVPDGDRVLDDAAALALATSFEGHPDNVAACLAGGLTIAWSEQSPVRETAASLVPRLVRLDPSSELVPVVCVPEWTLTTEQARGLLPDRVGHHEAAVNAGRAALLVAALTRHPELLWSATEDRLHQHYRAPAMPETIELLHRLRARGVPAVVSGAGPSVLAFTHGEGTDSIGPEVGTGWHIHLLNVEREGARVRQVRS